MRVGGVRLVADAVSPHRSDSRTIEEIPNTTAV